MVRWEEIAIGIITAVIVWLFVRQERQGNSMASIETKLNNILDNQKQMNDKQKQLDDKLNTFLKNEVDALKELTRQGFARNKG